jgi:hypothetical protein
MANKTVDRHTLWQRVDQGLTFTKNASYTMASTSGLAITAFLYSEANASPILVSGIAVIDGSPTGNGEDVTIAITLDTLTGITLTEDTWFELVAKASDGTVYIPNAITADRVMILLRKQPA